MKQTESIKFSKKIYSQKSIRISIEAFKRLAEFEVTSKGDYFIVKINKINAESASIIKGEFSNFILATIKEI